MGRTRRIYFETERTTITRTKGWVEIDLDYTQFYDSLGKTICTIDSMLAVKLLCWLFTQINESNMFTFNDLKIDEFNRWLKDNKSKVYNKRSVYVALKELITKKIVLKWSNGSYQLNPIFIWSDTIENRIKHLEQLGRYNEFELIEENVTRQ
ncbi:MAG: hypothetical protein NZZ41_02210 [Candidatus Dojkabacteria bacterium]|nr:hypothetical protein [Candidatus Dojkabacteria bacterium]